MLSKKKKEEDPGVNDLHVDSPGSERGRRGGYQIRFRGDLYGPSLTEESIGRDRIYVTNQAIHLGTGNAQRGQVWDTGKRSTLEHQTGEGNFVGPPNISSSASKRKEKTEQKTSNGA